MSNAINVEGLLHEAHTSDEPQTGKELKTSYRPISCSFDQ